MTAPSDVGLPEPVPRDGGTPALAAPAPLSLPQHLRGHYAGFATRFIAFAFDCVLSIAVFELVLAAASFAASVLAGTSIHWHRGSLWVIIAFFAWQFFYYAYFWTASGKTPGMTLLGVQVVGRDGSHVGTRRGLVRTLAFPLSFLLLGLGFAGILLGRDRRALHDSIADTAVVYTWDARAARLRFLAREGNSRRSLAAYRNWTAPEPARVGVAMRRLRGGRLDVRSPPSLAGDAARRQECDRDSERQALTGRSPHDRKEPIMTMPAKAEIDSATRDALAGLAVGDLEVLEELLELREAEQQKTGLDARTFALVKIAALVALDAPPASYLWQVANALDAGATAEDLIGVLRAVAPQVGGPRVVAAAPEIMVALGLALPEGQ